MKKVNKSKEPTLKQMLNMASNLREKFGKPSAIEINAWDYNTSEDNTNKTNFCLYIESKHSIDFDFWYELQGYYFGLMEDTNA